jgi:hypothetical protein
MSKYNNSNYEKNPEWLEENYSHVLLDGKTKRVYIATSRIDEEKAEIYKWLGTQVEYYDVQSIVWNGHSLYFESKSGKLEFVGNRTDLMEMIEELKAIPKNMISEILPGKKRTFMNAY